MLKIEAQDKLWVSIISTEFQMLQNQTRISKSSTRYVDDFLTAEIIRLYARFTKRRSYFSLNTGWVLYALVQRSVQAMDIDDAVPNSTVQDS